MLEILAGALLAGLLGALAAALLLRARGDARGAGAGEQARLVAAVEALARQGAGVEAAAQAQQQRTAALVEAARAGQAGVHALGASVAAQRQQLEGLRAALAATAQGLGEVRQAAELQRQAHGEARAALAAQLAEARQALERVQAAAQARAGREEAAWDSLARLEAILAGSRSRGAAGEHVLAEVLRQLPPELRAHDVRIQGRVVEFAIPLPDGRVLPVDSKWPGADKLAALAACGPGDAQRRAALVAAVRRDVEARVEEVAGYLDPEATCMMAVLAVPDAVYELCDGAHVAAHRRGVVIVGYSLAVPYVLSLLQLARRFDARVDQAQLAHLVRAVEGCLDAMGEELEGRLSRAIASLENGRRDLRAQVGRARQALAQARVEERSAGSPAERGAEGIADAPLART